MYQAEETGRNGFKFFTPAMNVCAVARQSTEEDLRHALEQGEFTLYYQPKVDLRTGAINGVEAFLRWILPTRGLLSPLKFIPVAEDSGLILPIGARSSAKPARRLRRGWRQARLKPPWPSMSPRSSFETTTFLSIYLRPFATPASSLTLSRSS